MIIDSSKSLLIIIVVIYTGFTGSVAFSMDCIMEMENQVTKRPYKKKEQAFAELNDYIYNFDKYHDIFPKDIKTVHVENFIEQRLQNKKAHITPVQARQMVKLADFYNARRLVVIFLKELEALKKHEGKSGGKNKSHYNEDDFKVAITFTGSIAFLGIEEWKEGLDYFYYLLYLSYSENYMKELLLCYNEYYPRENSKRIRQRIKEIIEQLESRQPDDTIAERTRNEIVGLRNNDLFGIEEAGKIKLEVSNEKNIRVKLKKLVNMYIDIDGRHSAQLYRWSIRMILHIAQEMGADSIKKAFRNSLLEIDSNNEIPEEDRDHYKIICYKALEYFGAELSLEERQKSRTVPSHVSHLLAVDY